MYSNFCILLYLAKLKSDFFEEKKAPAGAAKTSADFSEGKSDFFAEKKAPAGATKTWLTFKRCFR